MERLAALATSSEIELEKLNVDRNINTRVKRQMERAQKEYYLNEKLKAIQKELGRGEKSELDELKKENRLRGHVQGSSRKGHSRTSSGWNSCHLCPPNPRQPQLSRLAARCALEEKSKEIRDINAAEEILNKEHYGLEKLKKAFSNFSRSASS